MVVLWMVLLMLSFEKNLRLLVKYQSCYHREQTLLLLPVLSNMPWEM